MRDEDYYESAFDRLSYLMHCYSASHQPKKLNRATGQTLQDRVNNRRLITQAQADEMWDHYMLEGER